MRKSIFILLLIFPLCILAQSMSSEKTEEKWRNYHIRGISYLKNCDFARAENCFNKALDILKQNGAISSLSYEITMGQLGVLFYNTGDLKRVKDIKEDIENSRKNIRHGSKREAQSLYNNGLFLSEIEEYSAAINLLQDCINCEACENVKGLKSKALNRLALCHYCIGDLSGAIEYQQLAVNFDTNNTPSYLKNLTHYLFLKQDYPSMEKIFPLCFDACRDNILRQFTHSRVTERANYWNTEGLFFSKFIPYYTSVCQTDELLGYAYNASLFSKGILLSASNRSSELFVNSGNEELISAYNHYLQLKGLKNKTLEEEFEIKALEEVVVEYQKQNKYDFRKTFRVLWTDVQNILTDKDIAIEFVVYPNETGVDQYAALMLKKGYKAPKFVHIADFNQISSIKAEEIYTSSKMYDLVWLPIEEELNGIENIYFSPVGVFHQMGLEYLPDHLGTNISLNYQINRLSSTKELISRNHSPLKKVALFGGADYDASISVLSQQSTSYKKETNEEHIIPIDSLDIEANKSAGFAFLEGTLDEVGEISLILTEQDIDNIVYMDAEASETNIKNFSDSQLNLIHIATHGFYYSDKRSQNAIPINTLFRNLNLYNTEGDFAIIDEDKMLTRSGLILSGANNIIHKVKIPSGVEDGILYADEISNLNFNSIGIVVLSACQSGLGDIDSSEGVFGLQRGFKLAGVKSIIMSLWKVDDIATQILMKDFYKGLSNGEALQEALTNAQLTLRTIDNGIYDKPEYWAAFILLDGLQ